MARRTKQDHLAESDRVLGNTLKTLRLLANRSQREIALILGVSYQQIQKYEQGINSLPVSMLIRLQAFYNIPYDRFFQDFSEIRPSAEISFSDSIACKVYQQIAALDDPALKKKLGKIIGILTQ